MESVRKTYRRISMEDPASHETIPKEELEEIAPNSCEEYIDSQINEDFDNSISDSSEVGAIKLTSKSNKSHSRHYETSKERLLKGINNSNRGLRTLHQETQEEKEIREAQAKAAMKAKLHDVEILKAKRKEEEANLDLLQAIRAEQQKKNASHQINFFTNFYSNHLLSRIGRRSIREQQLEHGFEVTYSNKSKFATNRAERNEEYVAQRKRDFAVSQNRVKQLGEKLMKEYQSSVQFLLKRCQTFQERTKEASHEAISQNAAKITQTIIDTIGELTEISNALSFVPQYYTIASKIFNSRGIVFDRYNQNIPEYMAEEFISPLSPDIRRLFVTLYEACNPETMTPPLLKRRCKAICVLMKPLLFSREQCEEIATRIGWKSIFVEDFKDTVSDLFSFLVSNEEPLIVFGFPHTPSELNHLKELFNPITKESEEKKFLPKPVPTEISPFDLILELKVEDYVILEDILASYVNCETGETTDIRKLELDSEDKLVKLRPSPDLLRDIDQYPLRSAILSSNFKLLQKSNSDIYRIIQVSQRKIDNAIIDEIQSITDSIPNPEEPKYEQSSLYESLFDSVKNLTSEQKEYLVDQLKTIESDYQKSVLEGFKIINQAYLIMIDHLSKARKDMQEFMARGGSSQHLVTEFQEWHSTQVERCMRRMPKVKDECTLRLTQLREQLTQIENDRRTEEEGKQKDVLNANFRQTLFEIFTNACYLLSQAEIDRWTSARSLLLNLNQVIIQGEIVPGLSRRKLPLINIDSKKERGRTQTRKTKNSSQAKSRLEGKLPPYESDLPNVIEGLKKYVIDAAVIYTPATTPVSTRGRRPVRDKNPFAAHKISAIDDFLTSFKDEDLFLIKRMDIITVTAQEECNCVQNAFNAFIEESTQWIEAHYNRRRAIIDTGIAYMLDRVKNEQQINALLFFNDDKCVVDFKKLLAANEESPRIPPVFPDDIIQESAVETAEHLYQKMINFETEYASSN